MSGNLGAAIIVITVGRILKSRRFFPNGIKTQAGWGTVVPHSPNLLRVIKGLAPNPPTAGHFPLISID